MKEISFFEKVFHVAKQIPKGKVTSYGAIANFIGAKGSARMVGWAMNKPFSSTENIPAHRVVNRNGILTGKNHFSTADLMQKLLESEGIEVVDDKIINFKSHFWDPAKELK